MRPGLNEVGLRQENTGRLERVYKRDSCFMRFPAGTFFFQNSGYLLLMFLKTQSDHQVFTAPLR